MTAHAPIESRTSGVPAWALAFTAVVLLAGGAYFGTNLAGENPSAASSTPEPSGSEFNAVAIMDAAGCQACHGPDLAGVAVFPSLHGVKDGPVSENLADLFAANPDTWAELWIAGTDPATSDAAMRGGMPAFGGPPYSLSPEEIAAVVAYLKTLP
ncbi:MAG: cytochrome c [Chloroflexota bacterium]|nr:cytochrome c [Chloroflexota bacterium]